jgi:hypothetical protein
MMDLIFVYNADSGKLSALFDAGHKIVSPDTYKCNLCTLTHGTFTERKAWKAFRESASLNLVFLHKDEFERRFENTFSYPIVLRREKALEVFISTEELNAMSNPEELIELITERAI